MEATRERLCGGRGQIGPTRSLYACAAVNADNGALSGRCWPAHILGAAELYAENPWPDTPLHRLVGLGGIRGCKQIERAGALRFGSGIGFADGGLGLGNQGFEVRCGGLALQGAGNPLFEGSGHLFAPFGR